MTEAEWLACTDPQKMLGFLRGTATDRKFRLFAVACCRRIWHILIHSRPAVELAERYLEGQASLTDFEDARNDAEVIWSDPEFGEDVTLQHPYRGYSTLWSEDADSVEVAEHCAQMIAEAVAGPGAPDSPEPPAQCDILRCIFGNPFRPVTMNPSWLVPTVTGLAETIYQERAFDRMPILADALEDAGCTSPDILNHCRQPGEHARGCWVIDLLTGRK